MIPRSAWYAGAAALAATASFAAAAGRPDGDRAAALDGAQVFTLKGCAMCHVGPDGNDSIQAGPSLAAAPTWAGERVDGMSAEEYIEQSIRSPSAVISPEFTRTTGGPTTGMPLLQVSDDEIAALVHYLLDSTPLATDADSE